MIHRGNDGRMDRVRALGEMKGHVIVLDGRMDRGNPNVVKLLKTLRFQGNIHYISELMQQLTDQMMKIGWG
jgi:hypothetical protein